LLFCKNRARIQEMSSGRKTQYTRRSHTIGIITPPTVRALGFSMGRILTEDPLASPRDDELHSGKDFFELKYPFNTFPKAPCSLGSSPLAKAWEIALNKLWKADHKIMAFFDHIPGAEVFNEQEDGLKVFLTRSHEIGIAPKGIKNSDILCRFPGNDIPGNVFSAILRSGDDGSYKIVGRAIISKRKLITSQTGQLEWPLPEFGYLTHEFRAGISSEKIIELDIPMPILQALTCPLRWKGTRSPAWYDALDGPVTDDMLYWRSANRHSLDLNESIDGQTFQDLAEACLFLV